VRLRSAPSLRAPQFRHSRHYDQVMAERKAEAERKRLAEEAVRRSRRARRLAKDLLPPVATRALRQVRRGGH
jgi:hypothetical protein